MVDLNELSGFKTNTKKANTKQKKADKIARGN